MFVSFGMGWVPQPCFFYYLGSKLPGCFHVRMSPRGFQSWKSWRTMWPHAWQKYYHSVVFILFWVLCCFSTGCASTDFTSLGPVGQYIRPEAMGQCCGQPQHCANGGAVWNGSHSQSRFYPTLWSWSVVLLRHGCQSSTCTAPWGDHDINFWLVCGMIKLK